MESGLVSCMVGLRLAPSARAGRVQAPALTQCDMPEGPAKIETKHLAVPDSTAQMPWPHGSGERRARG